jgi:pyruvate ferredoxin oxidoreductase alpha subunit
MSFRPFPHAALAQAVDGIEHVIVLDRADSPGGTPPLRAEVAASLYGSEVRLSGHVYGLGGRDFHPEDARALFEGDREEEPWLV